MTKVTTHFVILFMQPCSMSVVLDNCSMSINYKLEGFVQYLQSSFLVGSEFVGLFPDPVVQFCFVGKWDFFDRQQICCPTCHT